MNLLVFEIKSKDKRTINTEIFFNIATARVTNTPLLRLDINKKNNETVLRSVNASLKNAKKRDLIDTFVPFEDMKGNVTAAIYLTNKFPELLLEEESEEYYSVFVKI